MDYPDEPNLIAHALEAENFPWLESEDLKDGAKGEVRGIPSVRSIQPTVTVSEMLGPIYEDWRESP